MLTEHLQSKDTSEVSDESVAKKIPAISFDSATKTQPSTVHHKSLTNNNGSSNGGNNNIASPTPILKTNKPIISSTINTLDHEIEDNNDKIQAISNLRCPSPPPILNKPSSSEPSPQPQLIYTNNNNSNIDQQGRSRSATPQHQQQLMPSILVQSNPSSPGSATHHSTTTTTTTAAANNNKNNIAGPVYNIDDLKSPLSISSSALALSSQPLSSQSSINNNNSNSSWYQQHPHKDVVPAGGVYLKGRAAAQAVVAAVLLQTARNRNSHSNLKHLIGDGELSSLSNNEELLSEVNLQINEEQFSHHKAPSVHAHFYLDETLRHGPRSRSGSGSTSESRNISEQLQLLDNSAARKTTIGQQQQQQPMSATTAISSTTMNSILGQTPVVTKQTVDARLPSDDNKLHVLFGICGTVSTKKTRLIINKLEEIYGADKISVQIIITLALEHFVSRGEFPSDVQIWRDKDEWTTWGGRSDPVLHIELRRWADILVIAPLTSNTLSKIALGLCDNLLTNVVRAWNTQYPILVAPSMVSYLYNSPVTKRHLKVIRDEMKWIEILKPTEKIVGSYGDIGMGGMMDWNEIVKTICLKLHELGFNDDEEEEEEDTRELNSGEGEEEEEEEDDDDEEDEEDKRVGDRGEKKDDDEEDDDDDDDDDDDGLKISVADEDEIELVLKK